MIVKYDIIELCITTKKKVTVWLGVHNDCAPSRKISEPLDLRFETVANWELFSHIQHSSYSRTFGKMKQGLIFLGLLLLLLTYAKCHKKLKMK